MPISHMRMRAKQTGHVRKAERAQPNTCTYVSHPCRAWVQLLEPLCIRTTTPPHHTPATSHPLWKKPLQSHKQRNSKQLQRTKRNSTRGERIPEPH
jgi:hypothetical protein